MMSDPPPRFSVVIPTLNEETEIGACLDSLLRATDGLDLIVADGGSTDATERLVRSRSEVRWVSGSPGRSTQMNAGARLASGEVLVFLHADTRLPKGAFQMIKRTLRQSACVAGSFRLTFAPATPLLRFFGWLSGLNLSLTTYGDQAYFIRRSTFEEIGGFREIPICEDVDFQRRLRRLGRWGKIHEPVVTSSRRFLTNGPLRQQILNLAVVSCFMVGVSPHRLHRWYYGIRG